MTNYEKAISDAIIEFFIQQNTKIKASGDFQDILLAYFHNVEKRIQTRKRQAVISEELKSKLDNNEIEEKYLIALNDFISKFETGQDMNGYLSKKIYEGDFYDKLLICWDIHHLHLTSVEAHNKREMTNNRSEILLFCIIKQDFVYFVDIEAHGKEYVFSTFNLLNIISQNWIHLIDKYEIKGIIPVSLQPVIREDKDINEFRKLNINITFELNNKYYSFIGLNSAGSSAEDTMKVLKIRRNILKIVPKPPIYARSMEFALTPNEQYLGVLTWYEGYEKKQHYL